MTDELLECARVMPVWLTPGGMLPQDSPDARTISRWEKRGWIQLIDEAPRKRWALTPGALRALHARS